MVGLPDCGGLSDFFHYFRYFVLEQRRRCPPLTEVPFTMKSNFFTFFFTLCALFFLPPDRVAAQKGRELLVLPAEVVTDKIRGGLLGQIIGNLNGIPYEFRFYDQPGNVEHYTPSLPQGAYTDDDTDFEWVYVYQMQQRRLPLIPYEDISMFWTESINRGIWCANRYARYLMDLGIEPPLTGSAVLNPWAEFNISGQFLCETFGLLAPAMPQTAAKIGLHYTRVAIDNEPAQTTQFFTTMIATAFVEHDLDKIVEAGLKSLAPNSIIRQIVSDVRAWHEQYPNDYKRVHRLIHEKYEREDALTRNRNGSELNTAAIVAALLFGGGNFAETIRYGMNFGYDADCNTATLGTIVGTLYGYRRLMCQGWTIVDRYKNTTRDNMPNDETITGFADRLVELFELINEGNGGNKNVTDNRVVYNIPAEEPAMIVPLLSLEEQRAALVRSFQIELPELLKRGGRQEKARAAYLAVCLDMDKTLKKTYPQQWKEACHALSGYWKVMNNLFYGDVFKSHLALTDKFSKAGFRAPAKRAETNELYDDREAWKDPQRLY